MTDDTQVDWLEAIQSHAGKIAAILGRDSPLVMTLRPAYEFFLDAASGGGGIPWNINGELFRIDPSQRHRMAHDYESDVARILLDRLHPGMTAVDVGANVGVYALQMARVVGPMGRVIAFEPNPSARAFLEKHVSLNGFENIVTIVPAALSASGRRWYHSTATDAWFFSGEADGMSRLGAPNPQLGHIERITVPVETLDGWLLLNGARPNVVLIDVEGFEADVLDGARTTVQRFYGAISFFVEMHPSAWRDAGSDSDRMESLLKELRLTPIPVIGQTDPMKDHCIVELVPSD